MNAVKYVKKFCFNKIRGQDPQAVYNKRQNSGCNIGHRLYFSPDTGTHGDAFFLHKVSDKEDAEFAVQNQQKRRHGQYIVPDKPKKKGYLKNGIGKGIVQFAKAAYLSPSAGGHPVQHIAQFRNNKNYP